MNTTIENLKKQALDELKNETNPNNADQQKEAITEVIAEIITFEALQARLSTSNKEAIQKEASELLKAGKFDEVQTLLNNAKNQALAIANGLPKYFLLNENGQSYLVPCPKTEVKLKSTSNSTGGKTSYPAPFNYGDQIYLLSKDGQQKSQVYQVTQAALIGNDDHEPIKASKAVEKFMTQQLGKVLPENFAGYPGTSHPMWHKLTTN